MSELVIGGRTFRSRLFVGTGKFSSNELMARAIAASESEMVTVAMKRIDMNNPQDDMLAHVRRPEIQLLPNTSGVRDAEEAVLAAQLAREAFGTNFIKLEIHPDPKYLLPDPVETLKATEQLAKMGFVVLPYIQADPVLCKRLEEAGAATVMPLAAPIGTNKYISLIFILSRNHNSCTTYPHIGGSCIRRTDQDRRRKQRELDERWRTLFQNRKKCRGSIRSHCL